MSPRSDVCAPRPQSADAAGVRAALMAISAYKALISPLFTGACRFHPSCSTYAADALREHGLTRGLWLTVRRLARCQPFGGSGFDPVPPRRS